MSKTKITLALSVVFLISFALVAFLYADRESNPFSKKGCLVNFSLGRTLALESRVEGYKLRTTNNDKLKTYLSKFGLNDIKSPDGKKVNNVKIILTDKKLTKIIHGTDLKGKYEFTADDTYNCNNLDLYINLYPPNLGSQLSNEFFNNAVVISVFEITNKDKNLVNLFDNLTTLKQKLSKDYPTSLFEIYAD